MTDINRLRKLAGLTILTEDFGDVRQVTNQIYEAMDDGLLEPRVVAEAALAYMSESEVADMAAINDWFYDEYSDDDDDDDEGDHDPDADEDIY